MGMSRAVAERAIAKVYEETLAPIGAGEPGGVVLVSSRGEQVASAARGVSALDSGEALTLHTAFDTGSVAKVIAGLAVAILEEEGVLSPTAPLRDVLPEFPAYGDPLRLEHLLHHESGLRDYFSILYFMAGWHPCLSPSPDEVFEAICRAGSLAFEPGSRYQYCDSNYFLLARIVERVTGERFGSFARSRILDPLGMKDTHFSDLVGPDKTHAEGYVDYSIELKSPFELRPSGSPRPSFQPVRLNYRHVGAEGLYASAIDLALLAEHVLSPTLVSPETMRDRILRAARMRDDGLGYGYGLNVGTYRGRKFVGHDGQIWGYSASVAVFPDDGIEIVALSNRDDLGAWSLRSAVLDSLGIVARKPQRAAPTARLSAPRRKPPANLLGMYLDPATADDLELVETERGLTASISGGAPIVLDGVDEETLSRDAWTEGRGLGGELVISLGVGGGARPTLRVRGTDGGARTFEPFTNAAGRSAFLPYEGSYSCPELSTTFDVEATEAGIRLRNRDPQRPSMDLEYSPTIRDFFRSRDPYPGLSQLQFLREGRSVRAFIYRDRDGDRREDFRFVRGA